MLAINKRKEVSLEQQIETSAVVWQIRHWEHDLDRTASGADLVERTAPFCVARTCEKYPWISCSQVRFSRTISLTPPVRNATAFDYRRQNGWLLWAIVLTFSACITVQHWGKERGKKCPVWRCHSVRPLLAETLMNRRGKNERENQRHFHHFSFFLVDSLFFFSQLIFIVTMFSIARLLFHHRKC